MESIHTRIRQIRENLKLSQVEFSRKLGITNSHISAIEKGKARPSEMLIKFICKEFRISEKWLLNGILPMYIDLEKSPVFKRVVFSIDRICGKKKYEISLTVYRADQYAPMPAQMFPSFDTIMYAYIFCVGIIYTAYQENAEVLFISKSKDIMEEIERLQGE